MFYIKWYIANSVDCDHLRMFIIVATITIKIIQRGIVKKPIEALKWKINKEEMITQEKLVKEEHKNKIKEKLLRNTNKTWINSTTEFLILHTDKYKWTKHSNF